jgi:hypothetical protein
MFYFSIKCHYCLYSTPKIEAAAGVTKWPERKADHSPPFTVEVKNHYYAIFKLTKTLENVPSGIARGPYFEKFVAVLRGAPQNDSPSSLHKLARQSQYVCIQHVIQQQNLTLIKEQELSDIFCNGYLKSINALSSSRKEKNIDTEEVKGRWRRKQRKTRKRMKKSKRCEEGKLTEYRKMADTKLE